MRKINLKEVRPIAESFVSLHIMKQDLAFLKKLYDSLRIARVFETKHSLAPNTRVFRASRNPLKIKTLQKQRQIARKNHDENRHDLY